MAIAIAEERVEVEPTSLSELDELKVTEVPVLISDLTKEKLLELLHQKEEEEIKAIVTQPPPPANSAPPGFRWVFNRLATAFEFQYDSRTYGVPGYGYGLFPAITAAHGRKRSILLLDPILQKAVFQLALDDEPVYGKPLKMKPRVELLDRTTENNLTSFGTRTGEKTRVAALQLNDVKAIMARRLDTYVELE